MTFVSTPEVETGVYANFVSLWHQPDCFVLDFSVFTAPAQVVADPDGTQHVELAARVVSRVRIPPAQVFELMKALNDQLSMWEAESGRKPPAAAPDAPDA
jgi:hypothetical protein